MPIIATDTGLLCPVHGCGGYVYTKEGSHNRYGSASSWCRRTKVCSRCGAEIETLEQVVAVIRSLFPASSD